MVTISPNIIADFTFHTNFLIIITFISIIQVNIITINKMAKINFIITLCFIIFIVIIKHINLINCYIINYNYLFIINSNIITNQAIIVVVIDITTLIIKINFIHYFNYQTVIMAFIEDYSTNKGYFSIIGVITNYFSLICRINVIILRVFCLQWCLQVDTE